MTDEIKNERLKRFHISGYGTKQLFYSDDSLSQWNFNFNFLFIDEIEDGIINKQLEKLCTFL